ncbi:helicase with zinc finger domain 2-like [Ylistrum balloti]|uniref:helicase with zinc finger domain 2-like n=1 Tax=Ylistrum balloti TaxID=509963 RepID=UPI002905BF3A|nr:helicase with zinc finger domain 2-like [Ylistrum balloti]
MDSEPYSDDNWFQKSDLESTDIRILHQRYLQDGLELSDKYSMPRDDIDPDKIIYSFSSSQQTADQTIIEQCTSAPDRFKMCTFDIIGNQEAICTPLDDVRYPPEKIYISGRSKCGQAFNEDIVVVEIIKKLPSKSSVPQRTEGRVTAVVERLRYNNIDHPVFVCTADELERNAMLPACKTVPKIYITNRRVRKEKKGEENYWIEIYKYHELEGYLVFEKFFKILPERRKRLRFLVAFQRWERFYQYPLGTVIGFVDANDFEMLRITEIQHMIPSFYTQETVEAVYGIIRKENENKETFVVDDALVFTIDGEHTKVFDDGFSVELVGVEDATDTVYKVGVHLSDVCRLVQKDDAVDQEARKRCQTNYAGMGAKPCHMLPEPLSTGMLSLKEGKPRHVITFYFEIDTEGEVKKYPEPGNIKRHVIRPVKNLCYEDVQNVLLRDEKLNIPCLSGKLKIMFQLATKLRIRRLENAHFAFPGNDLVGLDEEFDFHEAHYLVEEFMILTNTSIAEMLESVYPNNLPLRTHAYPDPQEACAWLKEQDGIADIIMILQDRDLQVTDSKADTHIIGFENVMRNGNNCEIAIDQRIWKSMLDAYDTNDNRRLKVLLRKDDHHPKQCVAMQKWKLFQHKAKYTCSGSQNDHHFGLRVQYYTTATSPIRRYIDLVIQRLILAVIAKEAYPPYTIEELEDICAHSNKSYHRGERFREQFQTQMLGTHLKETNAIKTLAIVVGLPDQTTIDLMILGYNFAEPFHLRFSLLGLCSQPEIRTRHHRIRALFAKWKKRIYDKDRIAFHDRKEIAKSCFTIDPNGNSVFVQYQDWVDVLCASIEDTSTDSDHLRAVFSGIKALPGSKLESDGQMYASDVCSEVLRHEYMLKHLCFFQRIFEIGQTLTVQIEAQPKHGCFVPDIQLIYVTETVAFCLKHVADPISCLARYVTSPAKKTYKDEADYIRIWTPILEMEEVTRIIRNEDSPLVKNVRVTFHTNSMGTFTLNSRFCKERNIDLGFKKISEDDDITDEAESDDDIQNDENGSEFTLVECSDFLCIRISMPVTNHCKGTIAETKRDSATRTTDDKSSKQTYDWVGHGRTTKLRRLGKKNTARYQIGFSLHNSPKIPDVGSYKCTLELLTKSSVHRRAEETIRNLRGATRLAKAVALRRPIPDLDDPYLRDVRGLQQDINEPNVSIPNNNLMQKKAIDSALKSSFSLIQGPPGTGKTFTGIKLIYLFHQLNKMAEARGEDRRQILFCGPSNKSVDLVARWMKEKFMYCLKGPRIVRFYSQAYECVDYPVPGREDSSRRSLRNARPDPYLKETDVTLHHLVRKEGKTYANDLRRFDSMFKHKKYDVKFDDVQKYSKTLRLATIEELQSCDVIFCTTAMAGNPKLLRATKDRIYHCIIDESGMCTEPETMVPIIATRAKQVVLIGDHKQLQPVIQSKPAKALGLVNSLFERYATERTRYLTMLNQQYRMNPWICSFPSKQFYDEKLETDKTYTSGWLVHRPLKLWKNNSPLSHIPIAFFHVEGKEATLEVTTEDGNENSKSNLIEARLVVKIFAYLAKEEKLSKTNIRILSQYNAQRQVISQELEKQDSKYRDVRVDTVVASQGGESDYIILSTVRSMPTFMLEHRPSLGWRLRHLGFIIDAHQINVALTRAKKGLIIVGNKHLLRCDQTWANLLKFYEANSRVFDKFPPS